MKNPYSDLPEHAFWKKAVASRPWTEQNPMVQQHGIIGDGCRISAAGSCFAQKVAQYIKTKSNIRFVELEPVEDGQPVFSARYGNIYTARQLLELFEEAESGIADPDCALQRHDGRFVDVNRPFVFSDGFSTPADVLAAREQHLKMVRRMFRESDVFVFTLGLTESWRSLKNGRVYPVCPGIYSDSSDESEFVNFRFAEIKSDLQIFLQKLRAVNSSLKVILTVSPVPLTATYSQMSVIDATSYSKSVLRSVCGEFVTETDRTYYLPSYEVVSNPYRDGCAYENNRRSVCPEVVQRVMAVFEKGFMTPDVRSKIALDRTSKLANPVSVLQPSHTPGTTTENDDDPVCDDVEIEKSIGF